MGRIFVLFCAANNEVPIEVVLERHDVDETMTDAAKYDARLPCRYIAWRSSFGTTNATAFTTEVNGMP